MRSKMVCFYAGALLVLLQGCNWMDKIKGTSKPYDLPAEKPTPEQLVSYLNKSAAKIDTIQVQDLDIDARRRVLGFGLGGTLVCQRPRNFRLEGFTPASHALEVDVGSNDREFWFYVKQNDPPYLYHCAHADVNRAALPFPFQPDWILEALGMAMIQSTDGFRVNMDPRGDKIELVEQTRSPQGQGVYKVTVFSRRNASGSEPQVVERKVVDARTGKEIYRAEIKEMQTDRASGISIPHKVILHADEMRLTLTLDNPTVNAPLESQFSLAKFQRPSLSGVQAYDLARRGLDPFYPSSDLRATGGTYRGVRR